jgi:uncharacterized MAPEG superfamily protein
MTADLTYLVWAVALAIVQLLIAITGATTQFPIPTLVGNREPPLEGRGWVGRAQRAHRNMLESLLPFAIVVLVAHVSGKANTTTALGAEMFFYARLAYAPIYWIGLTWLRTIVWAIASIGILLILLQLL